MPEPTNKKIKLSSPHLQGATVVYTFSPDGELCGIYISGELSRAGRQWVFHSAPKDITDVGRLPLRDKIIEEI